MSASQDEIPPPPPPPPSSSQTPTQQTPHTVSTIKLPILKKGEYDIWAMTMDQYLAHYRLSNWEVIQYGNESGLQEGSDRFQSLLSQLENSWEQVTKPGVDSLSFDDLYNNIRVFESDIKGSIDHTQCPHINVAFWHLLENVRIKGTLDNRGRDAWILEIRMGAELGQIGGFQKAFGGHLDGERQTVLTSTTMKVNTVKPIVNRVRPANVFYKTHSSSSRPFKKPTVPRTDFSKQKVNAAKVNAVRTVGGKRETADYLHRALKNKGIVDSGCSRHMTGNKAYLAEFQDFNGGPVAFGGSKGYITGKVIKFVDKKIKVLFTDSECLVLSSEFKLPDENQVLLKIPRQNNMYSFNLENIVPSGGLACLIAKATTDESNKWHRRLGHVNFKNLNKLVKGNLVRGLPSKIFQNDHTCVACQKGKQHKASCKAKTVSSISHSLQLLHMDLFGPTSVRSLNHKTYCLVITDDFSRFSWVFFLRTKDETSAILKDFIRQIENQLNQKVKTIRCDNGTEFKNRDVIEFCGSKGIKREYSNARTPQQNGVAERKNRTLIEAARTMLADSFLPNTFWAEAVSTACYVLNRVLVTKPHNKTPYELLTGKIPIISYIRPFGCHVTILNTIDHLGKFAGKSDEGFLVGYSLQSKAFRVYNLETKRVEENLHINFLENKPNIAGKGPTWLFDLDYLTDSMNYHPVRSENQANHLAGQQEANQNAGTEDIIDAGDSETEDESAQDCFVLPIWPSYSSTITPDLKTDEKRDGPREEEQVFMDELERLKRQEKEANEEAEALRKKFEHLVIKEGAARPSSTNIFSTVSTPAKASMAGLHNTWKLLLNALKAIRIFLAFASLWALLSINMDVKSALLLWEIDEENGYRRGTIDKTLFLKKDKHDIILVQVYVDDIIFGSTKKSWCDDFEALMKCKFQMSSMGELTFFLGLQVKQKEDGIFISQDKYVTEILNKFDFANIKSASTPIETQKPLVKDEEASDVDVHLYRSMIGSLMYLTTSRPDIMFAVCACSRFQVTPKSSHLSVIKRIFSDYARANLDRKSTTGGCQFLGRRLISWQCKKQTIVATSTTEAEYVAAASCCGQVLWIQNQMLDYGFNFMNTKIYIDNESTICIVKNPVYHSKTKHIAIRHHFIRDAYEKKLIQVLKIHTDDNVADLLTKAFDVSSTDSAKLVPLGKVCTAIETLKKNTAKALISLLTTITLTTTMAVLDSCPKHNMVAYLEKSEGNAEFHEIIDFLTRSSIHHALTVSPVVSTTFVEQFWTSAKSKIINNVRHITAKVAGKSIIKTQADDTNNHNHHHHTGPLTSRDNPCA
ncbi:putative ribonuclease H-like domain-containing protein [Tanacetum coccineum]